MKRTIAFSMLYFSLLLLICSCSKNEDTQAANKLLSNSFSTVETPESGDMADLLRPLIQEHYGGSGDIGIDKITFQNAKDAKTATIYFTTDKNIKGTIMHLKTGKQPIKAGGFLLAEDKEYIIDCIGASEGMENYYPATGTVECTCDDCQMKITEVIPPPKN